MQHSENTPCDSLNLEVTILPSVKIIFGISMLDHTIFHLVMRMNFSLVLEISLSVTLSLFLMDQSINSILVTGSMVIMEISESDNHQDSMINLRLLELDHSSDSRYSREHQMVMSSHQMRQEMRDGQLHQVEIAGLFLEML